MRVGTIDQKYSITDYRYSMTEKGNIMTGEKSMPHDT
jgi:hypothetical protein